MLFLDFLGVRPMYLIFNRTLPKLKVMRPLIIYTKYTLIPNYK